MGDHIAPTGDRNSQNIIIMISLRTDRRIITLRNSLKYQHISIDQTFCNLVVETRGEVALLTRNVNFGEAFSDAMQVGLILTYSISMK